VLRFAKAPAGGYEPPLKLLKSRNNREHRVSDQAAFQEVDDAVRQDELKAFWKRYGTYAVAGAVVLLVAVAGIVGWRQYQTDQRSKAGQAYSVALAKIGPNGQGDNNKAARAELEALAQNSVEPYRSLAALAAAQLRDTPDEEVAALLEVAPKLKGDLAEMARVLAGYHSIDTAKAADTVATLEPISGPDHAFHGSVLELQSLIAQKKGDMKRARELWQEIAKDPTAPPGAQQRVQALLNLTDEQGTK
jgi:hypothetical protein